MFPLCSRPTQAGRRTPHPRVTASVEGKGLVHGGGKGGTDGNGGGERGKQRRHFQMYAGGGGPSPPPPAPPSAPLAPSPIVFTQPTATGWVGPTPLTSPHPPPPPGLCSSLFPLCDLSASPRCRDQRERTGLWPPSSRGRRSVSPARPPTHPPCLPARPSVHPCLATVTSVPAVKRRRGGAAHGSPSPFPPPPSLPSACV